MCGFFVYLQGCCVRKYKEGEEVNEAAVVEEHTKVTRRCVSFDIPEDESGDSSSNSDDDEIGDSAVWPTSGL